VTLFCWPRSSTPPNGSSSCLWRLGEDLDGDRDRREALLWSFTVLGEASSQLDDDLKAKSHDVPWRATTAMRNRIVHGYWQISTNILLATAQDDIPGLLASVREIQKSLDEDR
jgi:uncharacterized protein with HEPN domain